MRESCMYGSVRGVRGNSHPYRDRAFARDTHHLDLGRMGIASLHPSYVLITVF